MFTKNHFINLISSAAIGLISLIFVYKYSLINFGVPVLLAFTYALLFLFVIFSFNRIKTLPARGGNNKYFLAAIILFTLLLLYFVLFTSKPDNSFELLSMRNWLDNFYHGEFPYRLRSTFTAYPFLYLFASPFYWVGNIALLEVLAWAVIGLLLILNSSTVREKVIKFFFLLVSPLTFYGLFESSGFFLSSVILITLIFMSSKYLIPGRVDKKFILFAVLFGFFFAIKMEIIIVLVIYLFFLFRNNIKDGLLFFEILSAVFLITIIPFILWNPVLFFFNGPFSLFFMSDVSWWGLLIFLAASFYFGWVVSDLQEIFFASGIILIIPSLFHFFIYPDTGLKNFIFCLPFLILSVKDYRVERFLGKVLEN